MTWSPARNLKVRRALDSEFRTRVRAWRPSIRELCPAAPQVKNRAPSAAKKGPGRVSLSLVVATRRKHEQETA